MSTPCIIKPRCIRIDSISSANENFRQERIHRSYETKRIFFGDRKTVMFECDSSPIQAGYRRLVLNNDFVPIADLPDKITEWRGIFNVNPSIFHHNT